MTAGAVDLGEKPAVISAIAKYHMTERARLRERRHGHRRRQGHLPRAQQLDRARLPDGADRDHGGRRQHPHAHADHLRPGRHPLPSVRAARDARGEGNAGRRSAREFDDAFTSHIGHVLRNGVRTLVYGITKAAFAPVPRSSSPDQALLPARVAPVGRVRLPRRHVDARDGRRAQAQGEDFRPSRRCLSMLYLVSATLKRYEDQGRIREDLPLVRWAVRDALYRAQQAIDGILSNFPVKALATLLRWTIFPLGASFRPPLDSRNHECATIALEPGAARDRLTAGMYVPKTEWRTPGDRQARGRVPRHRLRADRREAAQGREEGKDRAAGRRGPGTDRKRTEHPHCRRSMRSGAARKRCASRSSRSTISRRTSPAPRSRPRSKDHRQDESRLTCTPSPFTSSTARARRSSNRRTAPARFRGRPPRHAGRARAARAPAFAPDELDEVILGCAAPSVDEVNIGRVAALRMGCGEKVPAGP